MIAHSKIALIDDIQGNFLEKLLRSRYQNVSVEQFSRAEAIYDAIENYSSEPTLILLNAHLKFRPNDLRCRMKGMTFLRSKLRTQWRRREVVVVYSPFSQAEFYAIPHNRIMNASTGHYFFQLSDWEAMFAAIEAAHPIPDEETLDEIVARYGSLRSLVSVYKHDLQNNLQFKKFGSGNCKETVRMIQELAALVPKPLYCLFQIKELQQLSNCLANAQNERYFQDARGEMQEILAEFPDKYTQLPEESL